MKTNTELVKEQLGEVICIFKVDDWEIIYFNGTILKEGHKVSLYELLYLYDEYYGLPQFLNSNYLIEYLCDEDSNIMNETGQSLEFDKIDKKWLEEVIKAKVKERNLNK